MSHEVIFRRGRLTMRLDARRLYLPSHSWLEETEPGVWRIGLTRFAMRMLGEAVEHGFDRSQGDLVEVGEAIGWVEGFKAISDIFSAAAGMFAGGNPALEQDMTLLDRDPHGAGWLYQIRGKPDASAVDVHRYIGILDGTIERMQSVEGNG